MKNSYFWSRLSLITVFIFALTCFACYADEAENAGKSFPFSELGRKATEMLDSNLLGIKVVENGSEIACKLQAMQASITPSGISIKSTSMTEGVGTFSMEVVGLGRAGQRLSKVSPVGTVSVFQNCTRVDRPEIIEEFTVSADGIRQDFIVSKRPEGNDEFSIAVGISGATAELSVSGLKILLTETDREFAYSKLLVIDAAGKELPAEFKVNSSTEFLISVNDSDAIYPIRIDPTISDANWISMGVVPGIDGCVNAIVCDSSGNIYVGGDFSKVVGVSAKNIAKWDGSTWNALGSGLSKGSPSFVRALACDSSGNLYAGCHGGDTLDNLSFIAKWDGTSWSELGWNGATWGAASGMAEVYTLICDSSNNLYVGGNLWTRGGNKDDNYIAKWNGSAWSALGTGVNGGVLTLAFDSSGKLYAGGWFTSAGGVSANYIAKWNGFSWSALGIGMNGGVNSLAFDTSGKLYAGGDFTAAGGCLANRIAKWEGTAWSPLGTGMDNSVSALAFDSSGKLYAGGCFTTAGEYLANGIAKWNGSAWSPLGTGMDGNVYALAFDTSGRLYAGGGFSIAGEVPEVNNIAKWNGFAWSSLGSRVNGTISALAFDSSGSLYAGGSFTAAGGVLVNHIAKWNGNTWSSLGTGGINGSVYALACDSSGNLYVGGNFTAAGGGLMNRIAKWNGTVWNSLGTGMNNSVRTIAFDSYGNLYAGGDFTVAGEMLVNHIAKWDGTAWSSLGTGMAGMYSYTRVNAIAFDSFGNLYVGGDFTTAGKASSNYIAKWNGTAWSSLGTGMNGSVSALAFDSSRNLYAGGYFTAAGGILANYIAKWNGTIWSEVGLGMGGGVNTLAFDSSGNIYAGGDFTIAGVISANHIAKWDGTAWSSLGADGVNGSVKTLSFNSSGALYVGGSFSAAGGTPSENLAKYIVPFILSFTSGANGSISGKTPQTVNSGGDSLPVKAVSETGYHFVNWTGSLTSTVNPLTVSNVTANMTITANFAINQYTLTYTPGANGTISGTSPQTINHGSNGTTVTAVANTGYHFTGWSDSVATASRTDTNVTANKSVTANFAINTYTLTYNAGANGSISGTSPQTVNYNSSGTAVTAVANTGYHFTGWSDGAVTASRTDTNVTANKTVTANFAINQYTLTYTADANGTITGTSPQTVNHGSNGTAVTAVAKTGYHFTGWSDSVATTSRTDTNVTANKSVTANFAINTYTLTYNAGANGSISGTSPQTVNYNSSGIAVTAVANTGYHFTGWSDSVATASRTDTNVTANKTVAANFAINTYAVTFDLAGKGTRTGGGVLSQTVNHGSAASAPTITPNTGWIFTGWDKTFDNITAVTTVTAQYSAVTHTVNFDLAGKGNRTGGGALSQIINYGNGATAPIVTANSGWSFTGWDKAFNNITEDTIITAQYTIVTYTVTFNLDGKGDRTGGGELSQTINYGSAATAPTFSANPGWTFNGWNNAFNNITSNLTVTALWIIGPPVIENPGTQNAMVGVQFTLQLTVESESSDVSSVTVTGLPAGLKFDSKTKKITGVPTVPGNKAVTVSAKNVFKTPAVLTFNINVDPLPAWAQGVFNGLCVVNNDSGAAIMTVTTLGKVTGKLSVGGGNYAFSEASYLRQDEEGAFLVSTEISVDKANVPLTLKVSNPARINPSTLSIVDGWFSNTSEGEPSVKMYRNVWKDTGMATTLEPYIGYYTAVLPGSAEYGSGYLALTVDNTGTVKTTGKLADGTSLSLSGPLILDEAGRKFVVMYTSPTAYKGGYLFGLAEFKKPEGEGHVFLRLLDGIPLHWENCNPLSTSTGDGFARDLGLSGGWYDKIGNLYDYYQNKTLTVAADPGAADPVLTVGVNHYMSDWWDFSGIGLEAVRNSLGVMTGLSAPKANLPLKVNGEWNYSAENTVGLNIGLTRPTGIFKGSFKSWFDYGTTHSSKSISYEGVLTPEREDKEDGVEGRGFFLWADKGSYVNPLGRPVTYPFNWSYDFLILGDGK